MKVVRPYVGPNSYDFRTTDDVLVTALGCFDPQLGHSVAMALYAELLMKLCHDGESLLIQFQSHSWQQKADGKRLGSRGKRWMGSEWLAIQVGSPGEILETLLEFWTDKELRFLSPNANLAVSADLLERWYRLYLDDFDGPGLENLRFVADEIWGQDFLILRTASIPFARVLAALSLAAELHGLVFVQQREPFRSHLGPV